MRRLKNGLWLGLCLLIAVGAFELVRGAWVRSRALEAAKQAQAQIEQALVTPEHAVKKRLLNSALASYLALEQQTTSPNSTLDEAIGYVAAELDELPYAAFYYLRALYAHPRDRELRQQTQQLFDRLGQPLPAPFLTLSTKELIWLCAVLAACTWLSGWLGWLRLAWGMSAATLVLGGLLLIDHWRMPRKALVLQPQYVQVENSTELVLPGMSLEVAKVYADRALLLVVLPSGKYGYLNQTTAVPLKF